MVREQGDAEDGARGRYLMQFGAKRLGELHGLAVGTDEEPVRGIGRADAPVDGG